MWHSADSRRFLPSDALLPSTLLRFNPIKRSSKSAAQPQLQKKKVCEKGARLRKMTARLSGEEQKHQQATITAHLNVLKKSSNFWVATKSA
jgi:hypothetical protein